MENLQIKTTYQIFNDNGSKGVGQDLTHSGNLANLKLRNLRVWITFLAYMTFLCV